MDFSKFKCTTYWTCQLPVKILVKGTTQLCRTSKLSINAKDEDNYCMNKPEKIRRGLSWSKSVKSQPSPHLKIEQKMGNLITGAFHYNTYIMVSWLGVVRHNIDRSIVSRIILRIIAGEFKKNFRKEQLENLKAW